jgi:hypothetical protein
LDYPNGSHFLRAPNRLANLVVWDTVSDEAAVDQRRKRPAGRQRGASALRRPEGMTASFGDLTLTAIDNHHLVISENPNIERIGNQPVERDRQGEG